MRYILLFLLLFALPCYAVDTVQIDRDNVTTPVVIRSAAFKDYSSFATKAQGAKADSALQSADYKVKNVRTLGVKGNGSDEWALIQSLIDTSSAGDTWYFPKGTYGLSAQLVLPDSKAIRIIGDGTGSDTGEMPLGTTFKALNTISGAVIFKNYTTGVIYGGEISNLAVDCNTLTDAGIDIRSGKKFKLDRIRAIDFKVAGVQLGDTTNSGSSRMFYEGIIHDISVALQAYKWPTPSLRADYGLHLRMTASDNFVSNVIAANVKTAGVYDQSAANTYSSVHPYGSPEAYTPSYGIYDAGVGNTWGHLSLDGCPVGMKITHNTAVNGAFVQKPSGWVGTVTGFEISDNIAGVQIEGVASNGMDTAYTILGTGTKGAGFRYNSEVKPDAYATGWGTDLTPPTKKDVYDKIQTVIAGTANGAPTDATYIVQTASSGLSNEQALSSLSTGFLKVANGTGVLTSDTSTYYKSGDYPTFARLTVNGTLPSGTSGSTVYPIVTNADYFSIGSTNQFLNAAAQYRAGLRLGPYILPTETHTTDYYTLISDPVIKKNTGDNISYNMNNFHNMYFRISLASDYTGTITNGYTLDIQPPNVNGGSGVITNKYGLNIGNFGTGYAIKTGTGKVEFGDNVSTTGTFIAGYTALTDASATISTDTTRLTVTSATARTLTLPKTLPTGTSTANLTVVASGAAASVTFAAETGGSISWGDAGAPATTGTVASGKRQRFTCVSENSAATTTASWDCYQAGGAF